MNSTITPMMQQYLDIKAQYADSILFFRVGDFYETFYEDAILVSKILDITLTSRNKEGENPVPLAGVPYHSVDSYIARLVREGYKIAVCDQIEDPRFARGIVKRSVTRVITPGTLTSEELIPGGENNYLVAIYRDRNKNALSFADLSTGEFKTCEFPLNAGNEKFLEEISRLKPMEIICSEEINSDTSFIQVLHTVCSKNLRIQPRSIDEDFIESAESRLKELFKVQDLGSFGLSNYDTGLVAAAMIVDYLEETQKTELRHFLRLLPHNYRDYMELDLQTRRNLEILSRMSDNSKEGTLLAVLDHTLTPMGARMLRQWLTFPMLKPAEINRRLLMVESLVGSAIKHQQLSSCMKNMPDIERLVARISTKNANARTLLSLRNALEKIPDIKKALEGMENFKTLMEQIKPQDTLVELLKKAIVDDPPFSVRDGGMFRDGYNQELDTLRSISRNAREWMASFEARERQRTGIKSLKVTYNKVFGYYLEVTRPNLHLVPQDYIRKQTLVNAERFFTAELKEMENKILNASEEISRLEYRLLEELFEKVIEETSSLLETAKAIAHLDAISSLATAAVKYDYSKPVVNDSLKIIIEDGRHPVVETMKSDFVPNDTFLDSDENQILVITGPNMAGKSTYIRQVALITLMAQAGSFVPARRAEIGVVDRIFTRVGASDNLAQGQSTFMVEMVETANILNNLTPRSLVVLDEIGRGTSTFDGISIAWAVAEYLHTNETGARPRTLFATHYHELVELASSHERIKNFNVAIRETPDGIIFLRKIVPGSSDKSYGIHVAELAGLPKTVINRAKEILSMIEKEEIELKRLTGKVTLCEEECEEDRPGRKKKKNRSRAVSPPSSQNTFQLYLFDTAPNPVLEKLKSLDLYRMTPVELMVEIEKLQKELKGECKK